MIRLCAAPLAIALATSAIAANDIEARIERVTREIPPPVLVRGESPQLGALAARMTELGVPAVSIAVIHKGRLEWARGFGTTHRGGPAVTDRTLFQAASISKPIFALAVLRLAESGKVDLQADVNGYLKTWKVPDSAVTRHSPVTLRALLSHSAGITAQGFRGYTSNAPLPTITQILDGASPANNSPVRVDSPPGARYRYAGGGYVVAQAVVQDLSGQPAARFLQEFLLDPLDMRLSTFEQPLPAWRMTEVALPHRADGSPVAGGPHVYPELAAAGLWTTPSDLARYVLGVQAALHGKAGSTAKTIVGAAMARSMLTPVLDGQGLGPRIGGTTSRKFFTHNGGNEGYRCLFVAYEDGDGAVVMTNSDGGGVLMEEVMRSIALVYEWPDFAPAIRTLAAVTPRRLARLNGAYEFDDGSIYIVRERHGRLEGLSLGAVPVELFAASDHELFARDVDLLVDFERTGATVTAMRQRQAETERRAVRTSDLRSQKIFAWVDFTEQRFRQQSAEPRSEATIRTLLTRIAAGKPDGRDMSPTLAESIDQQLPALRDWFAWLGELKSLTFEEVDATGRDEFRGDFAQGPLRIFIRLNMDGRVESAEFAPG